MGDTFSPSKGYAATLGFSGKKVNVKGEIRVSSAKGLIEITCINDGIVPFRSYTVGLWDQKQFTVAVPYDVANDAFIAVLASGNAGTADTLILTDGSVTLVSGQALVSCEYAATLDDIQIFNVTFTYTGALTGSLVVT